MNNIYSKKYLELKIKKLESIIKKEDTVVGVAKQLNISRQSVHKWLIRYRRFGEQGITRSKRKTGSGGHNRTSREIEDIVLQIADRDYMNGVQLLSDVLIAEHDIHLDPCTIYRILKRRDVRYNDQWSYTQKYKRKKLYVHKEAGYELQVDTKYPFGYKAGKVVYTSIDDASRWVYCRVYDKANSDNTVDFMSRLNRNSLFKIKKIRTDQGTEFMAHKVLNYLKANDIKHRANTAYCPEENGKIERFHRTLNEKAISLYWNPHDSTEALQYKLSQFVSWYNYEKKHRGLGMNSLTPYAKLVHLSSVNFLLQCNKSL